MRICLIHSINSEPARQYQRRLLTELASCKHEVDLLQVGNDQGSYRENGYTRHEISMSPTAPFSESFPALNAGLSRSLPLLKHLKGLHEENAFDVIDVMLGKVEAASLLLHFNGPIVFSHFLNEAISSTDSSRAKESTPAEDSKGFTALVQLGLTRVSGLLGFSQSSLSSLRQRYNLSEAIPESILLLNEPESNKSQEFPVDKIVTLYQQAQNHYRNKHQGKTQVLNVFQVMEALDSGDAVSDITRINSSILKTLGQPAKIFARYCNPELNSEVALLSHALKAPKSALIFHYWGYNSSTWLLNAHPGPKAVHYHNITPPEFFEPGSPYYQHTLRGYRQLSNIADRFDLIIGDSRYNILEFARHLSQPKPFIHLYPVVEASRYKAAPYDEEKLQQLSQSGENNLVFVGRIARNKRQDKLMELFDYYYRKINRKARLWLVGNDQGDSQYKAYLDKLHKSLKSAENIHFTGKVSEKKLNAFYRGARVLICASEHEGFCVPLIQAMAFDVPVIANAAAAIPETMGNSGLLVKEWDVPRVAELIHMTLNDQALRDKIITGQRANLTRFTCKEAKTRLAAICNYLTEKASSPLIEQLNSN